MSPEVQAAWIGLAAQIGGGALAVLAALIAWYTRREQKRLRAGFLMLADEKRKELQDDASFLGVEPEVAAAVAGLKDGTLSPDEVHEMPDRVRELVARKYRVDTFRDREWKAQGKPKGTATGRPI